MPGLNQFNQLRAGRLGNPFGLDVMIELSSLKNIEAIASGKYSQAEIQTTR